MSTREERIAKNEVIFREVNERIRDVVPSENGGIDFLCECGRENCVEQIALTIEEYERVRADPVQFFVKPGHATKDVEDVMEENERFLLVKKHVEEQEIARRADPRA
jgi:hypothetical protein